VPLLAAPPGAGRVEETEVHRLIVAFFSVVEQVELIVRFDALNKGDRAARHEQARSHE
jgi:hypothetical protein